MTLNISIPENIENFQPKISVIGVGGAGCNAVNTMVLEMSSDVRLGRFGRVGGTFWGHFGVNFPPKWSPWG